MKKFYIITNSSKDEGLTVTKEIVGYLKAQGCQCTIQTERDRDPNAGYHYTNVKLIPEDADCVIVLGGDGTLLQAARDVIDRQIPLLGINMGTLGYLAEIDRDSIGPAIDHLIRDEYEIERRMMLTGDMYRGNEIIASDIALNDIVIVRDGPMRDGQVQKLRKRGIPEYLHCRRNYNLNAYRIHRIQPFCWRAHCIPRRFYDYDDTHSSSYAEHKEHYIFFRG